MNEHINGAVEKSAALATVAGGGWMTVEAMTMGLNLMTAFLGVVAAVMAIWWWSIKIKKEKQN